MYRPVEQRDHLAIALVANEGQWKSPKKPWAKMVDTDKAICAMCGFFEEDGIHSIVVKDSYVVVYTVEQPWFTQKEIINIFLVFKVAENGGTFEDVLNTLDDLAKKNNCAGICMGTALAKHDRALEKMFLNDGYMTTGIELYKEME